MPTFRIHTSDGEEQTLQAARLRTDATSAYWETRSLGRWSTVMSLPLQRVARVQRRLNEPDGRCTWITELPQP
ncbi:hypothetical protein [Nonomuraea basaltis]|uniref:hypothetical protein n=1 Tax=Nonomuraea basaltis TaxID=2495887 RepID=UPI00110C5E4A|nr:hypothetical protein [Nonomuraea basaltis]TMR97177.1 hypothetical protein EJK15_19450 [Nonomuraea basaltis]